MHVLIAGCGWLGQALAAALHARGDRVTAVLRRGTSRAALDRLGIGVLLLDLSDPRSALAVPLDLDAVLACQAPASGSLDAYRRTYIEVTTHLVEVCRSRSVRSLVYTGSTRVFGQRDGSDVDETTPPAPEGEHGEVLVEAERLVLEAASRSNVPAGVVRLSGLYGPGRVAIIDRVRTGELAMGPGDDTWMNFCHRDDAVTTILAALDLGRPGAVYHATDAEPTRRRDVVSWIASRLGIEPPHGVEPSGERGQRGADRRIWGERTRADLRVKLAHPSFREGLAPFLQG